MNRKFNCFINIQQFIQRVVNFCKMLKMEHSLLKQGRLCLSDNFSETFFFFANKYYLVIYNQSQSMFLIGFFPYGYI